MASDKGIPNSLPMLDGKNWIWWKKQIQSLFGFHEILELVTDDVPALAANAIDEQKKKNHNEVKKKDCKAAYYI